MPYLARTAFASSIVVGSGAQGPEAMCVGSSPTTSEMMSATTGARLAAARRPPWIADRCLRTVFISRMSAPLFSSCPVSALSSAIEIPGAGSDSRLEPPPEISASSRSSGPSCRAFLRISAAALSPASIGHRMAGLDHADALRRQAVLVARDRDAVERMTWPVLLHRERHRGGGLAGGGDEGAALGRRRQVRAEDLQRIGRGDRGAEALLEELAHQGANVSLAASLPRL